MLSFRHMSHMSHMSHWDIVGIEIDHLKADRDRDGGGRHSVLRCGFVFRRQSLRCSETINRKVPRFGIAIGERRGRRIGLEQACGVLERPNAKLAADGLFILRGIARANYQLGKPDTRRLPADVAANAKRFVNV